MNPNDVVKAIYGQANHASVLELATGGLHYAVAPDGTPFPYATLYQPKPSRGEYTFQETEPGVEEFFFIAKGVAVDDESFSGPARARDIAAALDARLNNQEFAVENHSLLSCTRLSWDEYPEKADGYWVYHCWGLYQVSIGQP